MYFLVLLLRLVNVKEKSIIRCIKEQESTRGNIYSR